ncbi:MAG: glycosyltransferase family 2 protein [Actinomycetia bacterium]|nr:glycosyltransferase family 2 protein [Actinomycetes bacterium]
MTVVMTMEVRNEADTIEEHIVYHLSAGFAAVVVADRGSTDGTMSILRRLARELPVIAIDRSLEQITTERSLGRMTRLAAERLNATWVVEGFIDEYWLVASGSVSRLVDTDRQGDAAANLVAPVVRFIQDPDRPQEVAHLRETRPYDDGPHSTRSIRRLGESDATNHTLEIDECCVGIVPPLNEESALRRAVAWGVEELLDLDGQRAASPRWNELFDGLLSETEPNHIDSVAVRRMLDTGELVSDYRIGEGVRTLDRSTQSAAALVDPANTSDTSLVVVVGMHRSGTSLIARVVNLLGVDIGAETDLMEAKSDNPTGFWENRSFAGLDDDLLAELGGRWDQPPILASDWTHDRNLDTFRIDASNVISTTFSGPFGLVKDPRMSLLLPFWRTVAPVFKALLVLRHPGAVAASLSRRDPMDPEKAAGLWIDYTLGVLGSDPECDVILYDEFLADPLAGARSIASILGLEMPTTAVLDEIGSFTDPGLRHHDRGVIATRGSGPMMALATGLFEAVSHGDRDRMEVIRSNLRSLRQIEALGGELDRSEREWAVGKRAERRVIVERDEAWDARDRSLVQIDQLRRRHTIQDAELLDLEVISKMLTDRAEDATSRASAATARVEELESESFIARGVRRFLDRRTAHGGS